MSNRICGNCGMENKANSKRCAGCGAVFVTSQGKRSSSEGKKNLFIGILIGIAVTAVAAFCLVDFADNGNSEPVWGTTAFVDETVSSNIEDSTESTATTTAATTTIAPVTEKESTTASTTAAPTTVIQNIIVVNPEPTTQAKKPDRTDRQPSVVAPGLNSSSQGEIEISDDLRYSLNLFLSNFSEANMKSFSSRPTDEELVDFAMSFNFINKRENFELLDNIVEFNSGSYNYRIRKSLVVETIEDYFNISPDKDFGKGIINYKDGYFYYLFTGGMIIDDLTVVTGLEYTGDNIYVVYFNLYDAASNNSNMYQYSDAQVRAQMNEKPFIRYSGSGKAYIKAADIYNYGTYYLQSYYVS